MKGQLNIRTSKLTRDQLDELTEYLTETEGAIVATAIDRMWHEEIPLRKRQLQTLEPGDLIGVNAGSNTHGCRDNAVLRYTGDGKAIVIQADSCTSCWQVGHDSDHVFATVGDTWAIDPAKVVVSGDNWSRTVKWEM